MKIGLVSGEFPPMEGGVGAFTRELAKGLSALGHEIHIVSSKKSRPSGERRSIWDLKEPYDLGYAQLHARVGGWRWHALSLIAGVAVQYHLDVINLQYQAAAYDMRIPAINFLPWRLKEVVATVATFHDLKHPYLFPKAGTLRDSVVSRLANSAEGVIVTNEEDQEILKRRGIDEDKLEIIPIGSNIEIHIPLPEERKIIRRKFGLSQTDKLLGFFGFINPSKGADQLVEALGLLDDSYHLLFIGGQVGSSDSAVNRAAFAEIAAQINDLNLGHRVHWTGFLSDAEVSSHLFTADLLVHPYRDGVSLRRGTLMAVLAAGRPLITTESRIPIPALIHGHNVWLAPIDDITALRDAIQKVAADSELQALLAKGAKVLSAEFSWNLIAEKSAEFMGSVAGVDVQTSRA